MQLMLSLHCLNEIKQYAPGYIGRLCPLAAIMNPPPCSMAHGEAVQVAAWQDMNHQSIAISSESTGGLNMATGHDA